MTLLCRASKVSFSRAVISGFWLEMSFVCFGSATRSYSSKRLNPPALMMGIQDS